MLFPPPPPLLLLWKGSSDYGREKRKDYMCTGRCDAHFEDLYVSSPLSKLIDLNMSSKGWTEKHPPHFINYVHTHNKNSSNKSPLIKTCNNTTHFLVY